MANRSTLTRKQQVLERLRNPKGEWVDGPEFANAETGGSSGDRRMRELRAEGYVIQKRPHPSKERDVWQYRLMAEPPTCHWPSPTVPGVMMRSSACDHEFPDADTERAVAVGMAMPGDIISDMAALPAAEAFDIRPATRIPKAPTCPKCGQPLYDIKPSPLAANYSVGSCLKHGPATFKTS